MTKEIFGKIRKAIKEYWLPVFAVFVIPPLSITIIICLFIFPLIVAPVILFIGGCTVVYQIKHEILGVESDSEDHVESDKEEYIEGHKECEIEDHKELVKRRRYRRIIDKRKNI